MTPTTTIATSNHDNNHRTNFLITVKIHGGIENKNVEICSCVILNDVLSMFYEQHGSNTKDNFNVDHLLICLPPGIIILKS